MQAGPYRRVVLKLSGEALAGKDGYGINHEIITDISKQVVEVVERSRNRDRSWWATFGAALRQRQSMDRATARL